MLTFSKLTLSSPGGTPTIIYTVMDRFDSPLGSTLHVCFAHPRSRDPRYHDPAAVARRKPCGGEPGAAWHGQHDSMTVSHVHIVATAVVCAVAASRRDQRRR